MHRKGAVMAKKRPKTQIALYLDKVTIQNLDALKDAMGRSRNNLIEMILTDYIMENTLAEGEE